MEVRVHPRVMEKRQEITVEDVITAFHGSLRSRARDTDPVQWGGVGMDSHGRILEFVAAETADHDWLVFHAMAATKKTLYEVGLRRKET
ncbi:MAG: hypothetical protein ACTH1D_03195 [Mycobacteriaceae bacterium]|uniref:hypothetical protein n=1 Tax=Corynebacterium sp. TaxID=1720 RepID=UPI003F9B69A4